MSFQSACETNDLDALKKIINCNDFRAQREIIVESLKIACAKDNEVLAKFLYEGYVLPGRYVSHGRYMLHDPFMRSMLPIAAFRGSLTIVEWLIRMDIWDRDSTEDMEEVKQAVNNACSEYLFDTAVTILRHFGIGRHDIHDLKNGRTFHRYMERLEIQAFEAKEKAMEVAAMKSAAMKSAAMEPHN